MPIEALLFDLGRVIVDVDMTACESALVARSKMTRDEFLAVLWKSGWSARYERGEVTTSEFHDFLVSRTGLHMGYGEFVRTWSDVFDPKPILPRALLSGLARRYTLTLISNTNEAHVEHIRRNYEVFDCFAHHVLSCEVGALKPDYPIFEIAIETTGHDAERIMFIDDLEDNVRAGCAMGLTAHRFSSPDALRHAFLELGVLAEWPLEASP